MLSPLLPPKRFHSLESVQDCHIADVTLEIQQSLTKSLISVILCWYLDGDIYVICCRFLEGDSHSSPQKETGMDEAGSSSAVAENGMAVGNPPAGDSNWLPCPVCGQTQVSVQPIKAPSQHFLALQSHRWVWKGDAATRVLAVSMRVLAGTMRVLSWLWTIRVLAIKVLVEDN